MTTILQVGSSRIFMKQQKRTKENKQNATKSTDRIQPVLNTTCTNTYCVFSVKLFEDDIRNLSDIRNDDTP